jgi:hypothetical protein
MIEQYLAVEQTKLLLPACIWETPVWRYLLYKPRQDVFDDVTSDPAVGSQPHSVKSVYIDGIEYTKRALADVRTNQRSWAQADGLLYVHYAGGYPTWLFYSHLYSTVFGFSTGKTRFFDGDKYRPGLSSRHTYKIEADDLEYGKLKFIGGTHTLSMRGEFDNLTDILGNNVETSYSLDGINRVRLNTMFAEDIELSTGEVTIRSADKREKLNVHIADAVFTEDEYPKMKTEYYGKNKQEAFGFCRGIPAVCTDQRDVYVSGSTPKLYRTFRAASVITSLSKIEVKMTQPDPDDPNQNTTGDVWVDQTGSQTLTGNGTFTLPVIKCMPLLPNGEVDYGNEPYEVRVTGTFRTGGTHWAILSDLLQTAMGDTWAAQCDTAEMQAELAGTGTVGLFVDKASKIFDLIQTLQSSGIYGWQLHDYRGKLTIRKDDNDRTALTQKITGVDILNINDVSVQIDMKNFATIVQVEYRRNYAEKSNNILKDDKNRTVLFALYRNDKTYTAKSYLDSAADARLRADYLLAHFSIPRLSVNGIRLFGPQWLNLRLYDIIGVYLELELRQRELPVMLMVLSGEMRRQEAAVFGAAQRVEYVIDRPPAEYRKFGGNIYIKIMRIEHDIGSLVTTIDGLFVKNI